MSTVIEILGPAAGPYAAWREAVETMDARAGEVADLFTVYKLEYRFAVTAVDFAEALMLALDTDMVDDAIVEALRSEWHLVEEYEATRNDGGEVVGTPQADAAIHLGRLVRDVLNS